MIPNSRRFQRGAYRVLMPNSFNGNIVFDKFGEAKGNDIRVDGAIHEEIGSAGDFNDVYLNKRSVVRISKGRKIPVVANVDFSIGSKNYGKIRLMSVSKSDFSLDISLGDDNYLDMKTYDTDDINIGNNNVVYGALDVSNGGVSIGNNNMLIDFKTEIHKDTVVKGFPRVGSLMFETKVTEYAGIGQDYIEVEDTSRIAFGTEIRFSSVSAAFVSRIVTSVTGNRVYFDEPLLSKESTFPDGLVFNEFYEILPEEAVNVDSNHMYKPGPTKRLFLSRYVNWPLRDVTITSYHGEVLMQTKMFFVRAGDNMAIIRDLIPDSSDISGMFLVTAAEFNPYKEWTVTLTKDEVDTHKYYINSKCLAFIGRSTIVDGVEATIIAYDNESITLDVELVETETEVVFAEEDSTPSGEMILSKITSNIPGNSSEIPVVDGSAFFIGQKIKVDGMSTIATITEINDNILSLSENLFDSVVSDKFYIGRYELSLGTDMHKSKISGAEEDLHEFIFGEN